MPAPLPENELARLAALESYGVPDATPSPGLDRVTRLVSQLLDVPIAIVSLVEEHRQRFASVVGLDVTGTSREDAFCAYTILSDEPMVVRDATADPRLRDNPLVLEEPHIRFYAGAPLITPDHHRIGSLCAIDRRPREPSSDQLEILRALAGLVMTELELQRSRHQLQEERAALELASRIANVGHVRIDMKGRVTWSEHARGMLGFDEGARTIASLFSALPERDVRWLSLCVDRVFEIGAPFYGEVTLQAELPSDVRTLLFEGAAERASAEDAAEAAVVAIIDVTENRRLRAQVERADRLATLGTLTAGVAHEINNPLTYIQGNLEMLVEDLEEIAGASPSPRLATMLEMLEEVRDGTQRVRRIVQGLRTLGRAATQKIEIVPLREVIESARRVCAAELKRAANFAIHCDEPGPLVRADQSQLVQVMTNLLVNACQAIDPSSVDTSEILVTCGVSANDEAFVEVRDTGRGMSPETQARAFDPFFTTKEVGVGTGLGLSICHGIITAHGGSITLDSTEGHGTAIRFALPRYTGPSIFGPPDRRRAPKVATPRSILCVDDDEPVLRALGRLLTGHDVHLERDAATALERIEGGASFDVILVDLMMPRMSGSAFYERVASLSPELAKRIVVLTGGAFDEESRAFEASMAGRVVSKPVSRATLFELIETVAGEKGA